MRSIIVLIFQRRFSEVAKDADPALPAFQNIALRLCTEQIKEEAAQMRSSLSAAPSNIHTAAL